MQHMVAGAMAGITEHVAMFPVDTIKTRMQALAHPGQRVSTPFIYKHHYILIICDLSDNRWLLSICHDLDLWSPLNPILFSTIIPQFTYSHPSSNLSEAKHIDITPCYNITLHKQALSLGSSRTDKCDRLHALLDANASLWGSETPVCWSLTWLWFNPWWVCCVLQFLKRHCYSCQRSCRMFFINMLGVQLHGYPLGHTVKAILRREGWRGLYGGFWAVAGGAG